MSATFEIARDDIHAMFHAAWTATGFPAFYDNKAGDKPSSSSPFVRFTVRHRESEQTSAGHPLGNRLFSRYGQVIVELYVPLGEGMNRADRLAKTIVDAFEGKQSENGVWFRNVRLSEVGPDEGWYKVVVTSEFEYTEVK